MPENSERPFRILLAGDFAGTVGHGLVPRLIDRDNFDEVLQSINVVVELDGFRSQICELEDFHPDRIYTTAGLDKQPVPLPRATSR